MQVNLERIRREVPQPERKSGDDHGPQKRDIGRPGDDNELLRRMRKVNPDQAKRYRQRSGQ